MDQDFAIGIAQIDDQHRGLLERIELLRDAVRRGQSRDAIRNTLRFLEQYAEEHFATEERYMLRYLYPGLIAHKAEHARFLQDLAAIKEKFSSLETQGEFTPFLGLDIARKLNNWFAEHVVETDRKMGAYLAERM
jgi:hemerythrin